MTSRDSPTVLAVDDDEELLETYEMWLDAAYDLRTASSGEAALDELDEDVQVVLLDRLMPGLSGDEVLERIRQREVDPQVAMVTAVEPDFDIAGMPFDAYVSKALDRETVRRTVERLVARAEYDDSVREHYAVAEKLAALEAGKSDAELADSESYRELSERLTELDARLRERADAFDRDDLVRSIESFDDATDDRGDSDD